MHGAVQGLHLCVGEEGELVSGLQPGAGAQSLGQVAFGLGDRAGLFAGGTDLLPHAV